MEFVVGKSVRKKKFFKNLVLVSSDDISGKNKFKAWTFWRISSGFEVRFWLDDENMSSSEFKNFICQSSKYFKVRYIWDQSNTNHKSTIFSTLR